MSGGRVMTEDRQDWTPEERRRVAAVAARASITMRERDGDVVPQWLRDVVDGKPIRKKDVRR